MIFNPKLYLKHPLRQYWFLSLKCYSDWQLGAIQIDSTPLTLSISEDSAKQLMISPLFTGISMIGLLGERNLFYVLPALFEIYTTDGILTWAKVALI